MEEAATSSTACVESTVQVLEQPNCNIAKIQGLRIRNLSLRTLYYLNFNYIKTRS